MAIAEIAAAPAAAYSELNLAGEFRLTSRKRRIEVPIALPGDVHTALLAAEKIPDPYFGDNEVAVMWVNKTPWTVERAFEATDADIDGYLTLTLENVDCIATVFLNGEAIAETQNQFIRYDIDVTGKVKAGTNTLRIEFAVTRDVAKARSDAHPFPIPFTYNYLSNGLEGVHLNFVRKTACHAGWDWGICLMPTGVYGRMAIRRSRLARQESVTVEQAHGRKSVELSITTRVFAFAEGVVELAHEIDGQTLVEQQAVRPGENVFTHKVTIRNPKLWWPNGQGEQPLYELRTTLDGEVTTRRLGLRQLEWIVEKDEIDHSFKVRVNGRDISMFGANWIPADAIPSRITPAVVRDLLESARAVNMNMIRIWGGGQYEPDWFYEMCDELGLLIWHDFMFACMSYPSNREFLADVRTEITQQVRRLQHHASIALWCGDNEVIGSLHWYPETKADPARYVANYDRLNSMLGDIVADEDPGRRFWPSSPSLGYLDFSDGWHLDTRGDTHYWSVWHEAKDFSAYRTVNPRFASEFGFQSFASMNVIETFAEPEDMNPSSPVMESHQRNAGGNARILETMTRYFRFPADFEKMVFLSARSSRGSRSRPPSNTGARPSRAAWARSTGSSTTPIRWRAGPASTTAGSGSCCTTWHGASSCRSTSWLCRMATRCCSRRSTTRPRGRRSRWRCRRWMPMAGPGLSPRRRRKPRPEKAVVATKVMLSDLGPNEFLFFAWTGEDGRLLGENDYFPKAYKAYDLAEATVTASWSGDDGAPVLTLTSDKPALFVTATVDVPGYFSDNAVTLLPGREVKLRFTPRRGGGGNEGGARSGSEGEPLAGDVLTETASGLPHGGGEE